MSLFQGAGVPATYKKGKCKFFEDREYVLVILLLLHFFWCSCGKEKEQNKSHLVTLVFQSKALYPWHRWDLGPDNSSSWVVILWIADV